MTAALLLNKPLCEQSPPLLHMLLRAMVSSLMHMKGAVVVIIMRFIACLILQILIDSFAVFCSLMLS